MKLLPHILSLLLFAAAFSSCDMIEDRKKANALVSDSIFPERATHATITFTDSGYVTCKIISPLMERYSGPNPYIEMTKGLTCYFYDKQGVQKNYMRASYGISYENEKTIEVRNNVILENNKGETLKTEKLRWNQATGKISTDQFVTITTQDEIIYGDGLESNQTFTEYRIMKMRGSMNLKDSANAKTP